MAADNTELLQETLIYGILYFTCLTTSCKLVLDFTGTIYTSSTYSQLVCPALHE